MKKRTLLSMLLMIVMAVSLVGCGADEKKPTTTDVVVNTTNKDDVNASTTSPDDNASGITNSQDEATTAIGEKESEKEETTKEDAVLKDGPKNPTYRKVYSMPPILRDDILNGECTLDELLERYPSEVSMGEEKIEYTDQGYIATSTYNNIEQGSSIDTVITYNKMGEIINIKNTIFDRENPDGVVSADVDFAQNHACSGINRDMNCTADIEVDSEGKIVSINKIDSAFGPAYSHGGCYVGDGIAVLQEDNRTIFYDDTTCEVYDVESRENRTVLKDGTFEMISYNSDGKIESISYVRGFSNGKDSEGNTYASIKEYVDYVINEGKKVEIQVEWTYDKNGNILMIQGNDYCKIFVY